MNWTRPVAHWPYVGSSDRWRRSCSVRRERSALARLGLDVELDVVALDLGDLHVGDVVLALGSREMTLEFGADLRVDTRRAFHVVGLEAGLLGDQIDHRRRGALGLDRRTTTGQNHCERSDEDTFWRAQAADVTR